MTAAHLVTSTLLLTLTRLESTAFDSSPQFRVEQTGQIATLRCVDRAWDGKHYWSERELFIEDSTGPVVVRKIGTREAVKERGYRFHFPNFDECDRAGIATLVPDSTCTMKVEVNRQAQRARYTGTNCQKR